MSLDNLLEHDIDVLEHDCGGVPVLSLRGIVTEPGTMVRLAHDLLDRRIAGGHVVVDLDGLDVRDPAAFCALFARLAAASDGIAIPAAVSDAGLRRLLRACGASAAGVACFGSLDEACAVARPAFAYS